LVECPSVEKPSIATAIVLFRGDEEVKGARCAPRSGFALDFLIASETLWPLRSTARSISVE